MGSDAKSALKVGNTVVRTDGFVTEATTQLREGLSVRWFPCLRLGRGSKLLKRVGSGTEV